MFIFTTKPAFEKQFTFFVEKIEILKEVFIYIVFDIFKKQYLKKKKPGCKNIAAAIKNINSFHYVHCMYGKSSTQIIISDYI